MVSRPLRRAGAALFRWRDLDAVDLCGRSWLCTGSSASLVTYRHAADTAGAIRDYDHLLAEQVRTGAVSIKSTSPGGRYIVCVDPFEAGAYKWVETPELYDSATGHALLAFKDRYWHLDSANWQSESVVVMNLRHYPGSDSFEVEIDCQRLTAIAIGVMRGRIDQLEQALERHLPAEKLPWPFFGVADRPKAGTRQSSSQQRPVAQGGKGRPAGRGAGSGGRRQAARGEEGRGGAGRTGTCDGRRAGRATCRRAGSGRWCQAAGGKEGRSGAGRTGS
jgi:hypothetical protein